MELETLPKVIEQMQKDIQTNKNEIEYLKDRLSNNPTSVSDGKAQLDDVYLQFKDGKKLNLSNIKEDIPLEDVDGIVLPCIDGSKFIFYPVTKKCQLLDEVKINDWKQKEYTEVEALSNKINEKYVTDGLLCLGSEAAQFVRNVTNHREFNLPNLLQAISIVNNYNKISAFVGKIDGCSMFDKDNCVWSSVRYFVLSAWYVGLTSGLVSNSYVYYRFIACGTSPL